jgi:L-malate glycosyltransferase
MAGYSGGAMATERSRPGAVRVSIFMPVYNGARYIAATIAALLQQSFTDFELIVADDGSRDRTAAIVRGFCRRDARVRLLVLPHRGEVAARNAALAAASPHSDYLLNHDSDDISLPDKLQRLVQYLDRHPDIAIVGCAAEYVDEQDRVAGAPTIACEPSQIRAGFATANPMINSCALIRRQVFATIGTYREEYRSADDYDFFCRALLAGFELANLPAMLHRIRRHRASVSATRERHQAALAAQIAAHFVRAAGGAASRPARPHLAASRLVIVHTSEYYHPHVGGSEIVVQELSEKLAARGHCVTVATGMQHDRREREFNGVAVVSFAVSGSAALGYTGPDGGRYRAFLLQHGADVIMNYGVQQWATDMALPLLGRLAERAALVIAPCGFGALDEQGTVAPEIFRDYYRRIIPRAMRQYHAAVYHSARFRDFRIAQHRRWGRGQVIPNGAREEEFTTPPAIDFRRRYAIKTRYMGLCVANFFPGKGQDRLLDMLRRFPHADFTLVLIGREGSERVALEEKARGLPVRILHDVPRADTLAAFFAADLFLLASVSEVAPLVIVEAGAAGLPFVSPPVGNVREHAGGVVCPLPGMPRAMARLLADETERRRLGAAGRAEWLARYTWSAIALQYETLYDRLLAGRRGRKVALAAWQQRLAELQARIDRRPQAVNLYREAAEILLAQDRGAEARDYIADGLELAPDHAGLQALLAAAGEDA